MSSNSLSSQQQQLPPFLQEDIEVASSIPITTEWHEEAVSSKSLGPGVAVDSFQDKRPMASCRWSDDTNNDLTWRNINMTVQNTTKGTSSNKNATKEDSNSTSSSSPASSERVILSNVWGTARAGETTAIMGASGAGKTSLFSVLAGRMQSRGKVRVQADGITLGNNSINPARDTNIRRQYFAYVAQEDALHAASTPRESLAFSARLRLPKTTTHQEIDAIVQEYLQDLGLMSCADSIIGGGLKKGISGGEKRRVSIGMELISRPKIVFLDEPTSGLDSFATKQVMALLRRIAQSNTAVIFTIHQPSSDIFASFDHLILLNKGRVMYQGPTQHIAADFAKHEYPIPAHYNPADWILQVAQENSIETLEQAGFFPSPPDLPETGTENAMLAPRSSASATEKLPTKSKPSAQNDHVSMWMEFCMLWDREKISLVRNPSAMIISVVMTAFISLVSGVIFFDVGSQDRTDMLVLQAQLGAMVNLLISTMMGQSQTALLVFSAERPLFLREYATNHYGIVPYVASHLLTEVITSFTTVFVQSIVTFHMVGFQQGFLQYFGVSFMLSLTCTALCTWLGAVFTDPKVASSMFVPIFVPQFYFSGVFIPVNLIPAWVRWGQWLCSLTYASRLAIVNEFRECTLETCDDFLEHNNADVSDSTVALYWLALAAWFVVFRILSAVTLRRKGLMFE